LTSTLVFESEGHTMTGCAQITEGRRGSPGAEGVRGKAPWS